jgi:hypothetical protein
MSAPSSSTPPWAPGSRTCPIAASRTVWNLAITDRKWVLS